MKTDFFKGCESLEDVKKRYRDLAKQHHPDRGGDTATMQSINAEYDRIISSGNFEFKTETDREEAYLYKDLIAQLIVLDGLIIELIGYWIWVSGNTKQHKEKLKELKFFWSNDKKMWYWRPAAFAKIWNRHKPMDIEEIRSIFNNKTFTGKEEAEKENQKKSNIKCKLKTA